MSAPVAPRTVLVVEDEPAVLTVVAEMLRRCGHVVLEAPGPGEALALAAAHPGPIDLLVSDVDLPVMGGRQLAGRMRAQRLGLRVLFMSGFGREELLRSGALDPSAPFLAKPFTADELVARVREVLGG